jgi:hypothetical protein
MNHDNIVSWQVVDALREIEHANTHDMCDRTRVIDAVADLGCYEAAQWLAANRHLYFKMLARARATMTPVGVTQIEEADREVTRALAALAR